MSDIARYDYECDMYSPGCSMEEDEHGEYVKYTDYLSFKNKVIKALEYVEAEFVGSEHEEFVKKLLNE